MDAHSQPRPGRNYAGCTPSQPERVKLLLNTLLDYLPGPVTSGQVLARSAHPLGRVARRERCPSCRGGGTLGDRGGRQKVCHRCLGVGYRMIDGYTAEVVTEDYSPRVMTAKELEAAAARAGRLAELGDADEEGAGYAWERVRARRAGDYDALERQLDVMRDERPQAHELLWSWEVLRPWHRTGKNRTRDERLLRLLDGCIAHVAAGMPDPARVPRTLIEEWERARPEIARGTGMKANKWAQSRRNVRAARLAEEGLSGEQVGMAIGVNKRRANQILEGVRAPL